MVNKTIFNSKFVFFRINRPKEWPMLIFFNFFLFQKSYKWIIAKNENQFGFILRFGPPINFTIKTNSGNRYKLKYPKYRVVRSVRFFFRIYRLFEFVVAIKFLSKNQNTEIWQKRIMIIWSFLFDSYKWLIFFDSTRFSAFKNASKKRVFRLMLWMPFKGVA